jgi:PAS domain S-box-containing protein
MLELIPASLFIIDYEGNIIDLNQSALNFIAESKENLVKASFLDLVQQEQKNSFNNYLAKIKETLIEQSEEFDVKGNGGSYYHTYISAKNIPGFNDHKNLIALTLFDLTFQHMQALFIKESQVRFENIANSAPVMIWIADVNGLFSFVNSVWCEFTGRKMGEELGLNWLQNVHPDHVNELLSTYKKSLDGKTKFSNQFRIKDKDNDYKWVMMSGTPRINQTNAFLGLIGTCTDITEQKKNEEKIENINTELAEIIATKDKFFSIISHDLRSPLSGLTGILEIISTEDDAFDKEDRQEIMKEAFVSAKNIYNLLENLLEWSQVQTGKITYEPKNIQLLSMLSSITNLYQQNLKTKGIVLSINVSSNISVNVDKKITETILRNLVSNAIKFTPLNGSIAVSAKISEDVVKVSVSDNGVGMDKDKLEKLFRIDSARSTKGTAKEPGTGLGLILCKELVEIQKGKILIESEVDKGSIFTFTLQKAN